MKNVYRVISNIRCRFVYVEKKLNIIVLPDEQDLKLATVHDVLRFWTVLEKWSQKVSIENPGWKINGEKPKA